MGTRDTIVHAVGARVSIVALCLAITLATVGAAFTAGIAFAQTKAGVAMEDVILRATPDDDGRRLNVIPEGATVAIRGNARNGFYPVTYAGDDGWVATGYLASTVGMPVNEGSSERGPVGTDSRRAVAIDDLSLREGPSGADPVELVIPAGGGVKLTGKQRDGFLEVIYNGTRGWALGEYLTIARAREDRNPRSFSEAELIQIIYDAADRYEQPRRDMLRVARCESELTPTAVNPRTGDSGLFQFNPDTWLTTPYAEYDIFDPRASAYAAGWMWSVGRRNEWVCQ